MRVAGGWSGQSEEVVVEWMDLELSRQSVCGAGLCAAGAEIGASVQQQQGAQQDGGSARRSPGVATKQEQSRRHTGTNRNNNDDPLAKADFAAVR